MKPCLKLLIPGWVGVFGILVTGCGDGGPTRPFSLSEYPLVVGSRWVYAVTDTFRSFSGTVVETGTDTLQVSVFRSRNVPDLGQVYEVAMQWAAASDTLYARPYGNGVSFHARPSGSVTRTDAFITVNFPLEVGKAWPLIPASTTPDSVYVTGVGEIDVGDPQPLDAYQLRHDWAGFNAAGTEIYWFAEGMGFVGSDISSYCTVCSYASEVRHLRLLDYTLLNGLSLFPAKK